MRSAEGVGARRAIACAVAGLAGCPLFVSLDDLSGGATGAASSDGSVDGAREAMAGDASASDASDGGDAAASCSGFCGNFDDRVTALGAWDSLDNGVTSNMFITTTEFVSPPHSLQVHMPPARFP